MLWEIELLFRLNRISYGLDDTTIAEILASVTSWPLDADVCLALRRLDFRSDPADEIIAATSLARRVPLMTCDGRLRASKLLQRQHLLR